MADEDAAIRERIGEHGLALIAEASRGKAGQRGNDLDHCNAGWLATVDWGTATAPIYKATRPASTSTSMSTRRGREIRASLTAWELGHHRRAAHDCGRQYRRSSHASRHGRLRHRVGTDRTSARGDVCNKIGTYLKALAAKDNGVPFYVAAPSSSIDFTMTDALEEIEIGTVARAKSSICRRAKRTTAASRRCSHHVDRQSRAQPRVRCDRPPARHRPRDGARADPCDVRGSRGGLSGTGLT